MTRGEKLLSYIRGKEVTTEEDYLEVLELIEWLERKIDGKWFDESKEGYKKVRQFLAELLLPYDQKENKMPF